MQTHTGLSKAENWLLSLKSEGAFFRAGQPPSLTEMHKLLDAMGRQERQFDERIVVTGSYGKGSCCAAIEAFLRATNANVAVISSPHLQVVNERIRLNQQLISAEAFADATFYVQSVCKKHNLQPTYYEAVVAIGVRAAAVFGAQVLIAEVGIGGRLDAVNALKGSRRVVITHIGTDHMKLLGGSKAAIAKEKSGIITDETSHVYTSADAAFHAMMQSKMTPQCTFSHTPNCAKKLVEDMIWCVPDTAPTPLPARLERISDTILLDGAHSSERYKWLVSQLPERKYAVVLSLTQSNNLDDLRSLLPVIDSVFACQVASGDREFQPPEAIQNWFKTNASAIPCATFDTPEKALTAAEKSTLPVLVTGSLYLCGQLRETWYLGSEIVAQQTAFPVSRT